MFNRNYYNIMVGKTSAVAGIKTAKTQVEDGSLALYDPSGEIREVYGMPYSTSGSWAANFAVRGFSRLQGYAYASSNYQDGNLCIVFGTGTGSVTENDYTLFDPFSGLSADAGVSVSPELTWNNATHKWEWQLRFTATPTASARITEWAIFRTTYWYNLPGVPPSGTPTGNYRYQDIMIYHENLQTPFDCTNGEAFKITLNLELDYPFLA